MCDINLRNVDPALKTELKIEAAQRGMTFKAYCVGLLSGTANKGATPETDKFIRDICAANLGITDREAFDQGWERGKVERTVEYEE